MSDSRVFPEDHPVADLMALTALMTASTLKEQLGDPLYGLALLATADQDEARVLLGERWDTEKERPATEASLVRR